MSRFVCCAMLMSAMLAGCGINSTLPLASGGTPDADRAVIVYGVRVDGPWSYPRYTVELAEYSLERQAVTGNCFHFNRTDATVPSTQAGIRYFAFQIAPGSYVYSPMNGTQLHGDPVAFRVPAGHAVYIGDFIYGKDGRVTLAGNLDAERAAIRHDLPALPAGLARAEAVPVAAPKPFLCTP